MLLKTQWRKTKEMQPICDKCDSRVVWDADSLEWCGMLIVSRVGDADSLKGWVTRHQPAFLAYCPLAGHPPLAVTPAC